MKLDKDEYGQYRLKTWSDIASAAFVWSRSTEALTNSGIRWPMLCGDKKWDVEAPQDIHVWACVGAPPFYRGKESPFPRPHEEILWNKSFTKVAKYYDRFGALPHEDVVKHLFKEILELPESELLFSHRNKKAVA